MLPQPELGLSECDVIGTSAARAMEMSIEQSPTFRRFIQIVNEDYDDISIQLVPYGASSPEYPYPVDITRISTGDWNAIAMNNNRVHLVFVEK